MTTHGKPKRLTPIERDARKRAADTLHMSHELYPATKPYEQVRDAVHTLERHTVWAVQRGSIPEARRLARAVELVEHISATMLELRARPIRRALAARGIVDGARVRVIAVDARVPIGTEATVNDDCGNPLLFVYDDDRTRHLLHADELEAVVDQAGELEPPAPHDDEHGVQLEAAAGMGRSLPAASDVEREAPAVVEPADVARALEAAAAGAVPVPDDVDVVCGSSWAADPSTPGCMCLFHHCYNAPNHHGDHACSCGTRTPRLVGPVEWSDELEAVVDELEEIPCDNCGRDHVPDAGDPTQDATCYECQNAAVPS